MLHNFTNCIWQCTGFFVMISALIAVSNEMLIFLERDRKRVAFEESTLEKIRRVVFCWRNTTSSAPDFLQILGFVKL